MSEPVLLFQAAGLRFGVSLADVSRLIVEEELLPVPFSHPAMAGLMDADADGPVPVFDLSGLVDPTAIARHVPGATVALFPTGKGPVGLRLDKLHGTAATYEPITTVPPAPAALLRTMGGAASAQGEPFSFFSPEAFLAAIGL
jgi:hypothetical protein